MDKMRNLLQYEIVLPMEREKKNFHYEQGKMEQDFSLCSFRVSGEDPRPQRFMQASRTKQTIVSCSPIGVGFASMLRPLLGVEGPGAQQLLHFATLSCPVLPASFQGRACSLLTHQYAIYEYFLCSH
jgi:hypothetical protein